jgi:hypothetical protein
MSGNGNYKSVCAIAALTAIAIFFVACGSSNSDHNLSTTQAQAISQELFAALNSAMVTGLTPPGASTAATRPSFGEIVERARLAQSSGCTVTNSGESCNLPITYQGPCPNGGTISVSGDFAYTLDNSGNGSDSSTLTVIPAACAVDNVMFSGNPSVTFATQFNLQNNALAFPISFSGMGGISYGPNPTGSCSINVKATATSVTSCSVSGSICGRSVSGSC